MCGADSLMMIGRRKNVETTFEKEVKVSALFRQHKHKVKLKHSDSTALIMVQANDVVNVVLFFVS